MVPSSRRETIASRDDSTIAAILAFAAAFLAQPGSLRAEDSPELIQPPICSAATVGKIPALEGICEVTPLQGGGQKVKINLTANTGPVQVGGYTITTEHYNNSYLTPVVEALPGDTVAARLVNWLAPREHVPPREHKPMVDGAADDNPVHALQTTIRPTFIIFTAAS